jgi:hypothetical protein
VHYGLGKLTVYTLLRFGRRRATVSRATARALSVQSLSAPHSARAARGRGLRLTAGQAGSGPRCPSLYGIVAGPQQAEHALCAQAELGFGQEAVLKLKIPFIFFI